MAAKETMEAEASSTAPIAGSEPTELTSIPSGEPPAAVTATEIPAPPAPSPAATTQEDTPGEFPPAELSDAGRSRHSDDVRDAEGGFFDPEYCEGGVAVRPRGRRTVRRKTAGQAATASKPHDPAAAPGENAR